MNFARLSNHYSVAPQIQPADIEFFAEQGFTSVVATNCTQEYARYLHPVDWADVSPLAEWCRAVPGGSVLVSGVLYSGAWPDNAEELAAVAVGE